MQAYIEQNCTIEHEGKSFTAGGAFVTDDYIVAYVGKVLPFASDPSGHYRALTDWHGQQIGSCTLTHGWKIRSCFSDKMHQIRATVNGQEYTGRGMGEGMVCHLRKVR